MSQPKFIYSKLILYATLLLGASLRIVVYLQNRSLFLDEANVCLDIMNKSYAELFRPFESHQMIPPFFASCIKLCNDIFGNNEFALRLFPLLVSLLSVVLFYKMTKKIIENNISLIFINCLFATSYLLIEYATEAKQYGFDALMTIVLILAAQGIGKDTFTQKETIFWIGLGSILIWFSMPTVFILFGIGIYMLYQKRLAISSKPKSTFPLIIIAASWLTSFSIYYFSILSKGMEAGLMISFHEQYFLPLIPTNAIALQQWLRIQEEILNSTIGKTGLAVASGLLFGLLGFYSLLKNKKGLAILFLLPIIVCWIASGLGKYSLLPRLALFYLPISLCTIGLGLDIMLGQLKGRLGYIKYLIIGLLIIVSSHQWAYRYFWEPFQIEEIKPIIEYLKEHAKEDEVIYVHWEGVPAFEFYTQRHDDKDTRFNIGDNQTILTNWNTNHPALEEPLPRSMWLVFSHSPENTRKSVLEDFNSLYKEQHRESVFMASCVFLKLRTK